MGVKRQMARRVLQIEDPRPRNANHEKQLSPGAEVNFMHVTCFTIGGRSVLCTEYSVDKPKLSMPLDSLPTLPINKEWNMAYVSCDSTSKELSTYVSRHKLAGVQGTWHSNFVDCMELVRTERLTAATFEASYSSQHLHPPSEQTTTVIAKTARFGWKNPRIEQETNAYKLLEGTGLAPRFLGHIHEHRRVMGVLFGKGRGP
jgi:hypothetical protein